MTVVPDIAQTSFGIVVEGGKDLGALQKQFTEKGNKVVAFVKSQGVDAKDVKTENYSLEPRYQYYDCGTRIYAPSGAGGKPCPPPEIVGYTLRENITVKMRNFEKIGAIMKGGVDSGANTVAGLSFTIDDPTKVESEARGKAITEAKDKAQAVAAAGGFSLGRLLGIEEGGNQNYRYDYAPKSMSMGAVMSEAAPAPTIEAGSKDVIINVTLRYEIR